MYTCPNGCGKLYRHRSSLYNHTRFECGKEKAFACTVANCDYKTKRKGSLKSHMLIVHGVKLDYFGEITPLGGVI
nr:unnamed protein product [Callosobruchus chinensis]